MASKYPRGARLRVAIVALVMLIIPALPFAASKPDWWTERGAINSKPADDLAVANIGQLKQIASKAREELDAWLLPDGAGPQVKALIDGFGVNLTQLPGVAATQSSTAFDGVAARAIDNNTDGDYTHSSVIHTEGALTAAGAPNPSWQAPWCQIDLGASRTIRTVELWNRTDNNWGSRLANFYVLISDTDMAATPLKVLLATSNVWKSARVETPPSPGMRLEAGNRRGRYVMVRIDGPQYLHLAEVKVYGVESPTAAAPDDFAAVTLGQLKSVAKPFYDRLTAAGYNASYPWIGREQATDDLAIANIGQLKSIFSFDVRPLNSLRDANGNGIPDWWEYLYAGHLVGNASDDQDGDGIPDAQEYRAGGNPNAADTDHDGLSDAQELALGTDPKRSDSDGDGVRDKHDRYPTDARRSSDIPLLRFAVIDVSTPITGDGNIEFVSVDDSNTVGFAWADVKGNNSYSIAPGALGTIVFGKRLLRQPSPKLQQFSQDETNYLLREEYRYEVRGINASGTFLVDLRLHATLCRHWETGDPTPSPAPPIPEMSAYPMLVEETTFVGVATWRGGVMPVTRRVSILPRLSYEMPHGGYAGTGITNGDVVWGKDGEDDFNTFIGATVFGGASGALNIPGFGTRQISEDARVAAGLVKNQAEPYLPYVAYWKENIFHPLFGLEDAETEVQLVDNQAQIFGFSPWFSTLRYFPHLEPRANHPFWYSQSGAEDFYLKLPMQFRQQVAFFAGDKAIIANGPGDILFYAHVADQQDGQPVWRQACLLWEGAKDGHAGQLREVEFPEGFEVKQMTSKLSMVGLLKQPKLDYSGRPVPDPENPQQVLKTSRATLLLTGEIMVDGNRDRKMSFTDPAIHAGDLTAVQKPFQFWVNNDCDKGGSVDLDDKNNPAQADQWEQDDFEGPNDCGDGVIEWRRDLEDFTRLWISFKGVTELVRQPGVVVQLKFEPPDGLAWKSEDGEPRITLFKAVEPDGGRQYLEDENVAWEQLDGYEGSGGKRNFSKDMGFVKKTAVCRLPEDFLSNLSETEPNRYLLFEGLEVGKGALVLIIKKNGREIAKFPALHLELKNVRDMYEQWSVGEIAPAGVQYSFWPSTSLTPLYGASGKPIVAPYDEEKDYILYVHGWNMTMAEKNFYADTSFKRLWHEGYKGRFGMFRWPTFWFADGQSGSWSGPGSIYVPVAGVYAPSPKNFDGSEHRAWASSAGLLRLFNQLNNSGFRGNVRVLAHSLGNVVVSEALRRSKSGQVVHTYVATQAALAAHFYDAAAPSMGYVFGMGPDTPDVYSHYFKFNSPSYMSPGYMGGKAGKIFNYFNPQDWALDWPRWELTQQLKPDETYKYDYQQYPQTHYDWFYHYVTQLHLVDDAHEIFAWAAEPRSYALGGQWAQGAVFNNVNLSTKPISFGKAHKWHSGQFRGTYMERRRYWNRLLIDCELKPASP